MDDPLIIFRGSSFFQFSDIHKIQKKTFPVRFMTARNCLISRKVNKNTALIEFITTNINYYRHWYFGDLGSGNSQASESRQFFKFFRDTPHFFFLEAFHVIILSSVESEPLYRLRYRLRLLYENVNSLSDALSKIWNMLFFIRETCFIPDIFKFIYFHFLGSVIVIVEEVNGEIFFKFRRTSIVP